MTKIQKIIDFSFYFVCLLLLRRYHLHYTTPERLFIANHLNFSLLEPVINSSFRNVRISETKLVNLDNFEYLINPKVCQNNTIFILFVVSSDPRNYAKRKAIRETWGKVDGYAVKIVFTFGVNKAPMVIERINNESRHYGDIVQGNFIDAYRNLTYKHVMGLKWAWAHCRAQYIVKSDDDTFIHRRNLYRFLNRELSPWGAKNLIACGVWVGMPVLRQNNSKWYVSRDEYAPDFYPPYCSGMFMIYSSDVLPHLVKASETAGYLFVDDAFVTGIVAEKANIPRTNIFFLYQNWEYNKQMFKEGISAISEYIWGPCNVGPVRMKEIWNFTNLD